MRKYLLSVMIISFLSLLAPSTHAAQPEEEVLHTRFRSTHRTLDSDDIKSILKEYDLFDSIDNRSGGFENDYELKSLNGERVVVDSAAGLMWHQSGSGSIAWDEAKAWIENLNSRGYAGHHDWRLPTVEEAASLLESSKKNGLHIDPLFSDIQTWIWTGDMKRDSGSAWDVRFDDGLVYWIYVTFNRYVRPVRSLE